MDDYNSQLVCVLLGVRYRAVNINTFGALETN